VRDRASRYGTVKSVSVSAFPAIELLWGKAESASMSAGRLTLTSAQIAEMVKQLWEFRGVEDATISAERATLRLDGLARGVSATNVSAIKKGSRIAGYATVTQQALDEVGAGSLQIQPLSSGGGEVEVRVTGSLFGATTSLSAAIKPSEGHLVVEPQGLPFAGLATITLISDPHVRIESVAFTQLVGQRAYRISLAASLL
jgi:hypothetical protein